MGRQDTSACILHTTMGQLEILVVTCLVVTSLGDITLSDSFTAPAAPKTFYNAPAPSYSAPSYSAPSSSYGSPGVQTVQVELPNYDYYNAGPPRVYKVHVPVTQRPVTVHVPQNVPVNFVPVNVPTPSLGPISVVEQNPFTF